MNRTRALAFAVFAIVASSAGDLRAAASAVGTGKPASDRPSTVSDECDGDGLYYGWGRARDLRRRSLAIARATTG